LVGNTLGFRGWGVFLAILGVIGQKEVVRKGNCPIEGFYWTKEGGEGGEMSNKGDLLDNKGW
jgi:hypothetical protein